METPDKWGAVLESPEHWGAVPETPDKWGAVPVDQPDPVTKQVDPAISNDSTGSDWLGVGEEVRGIGRALNRGGRKFAQAGSIKGMRKPGEIQDDLTAAASALSKFDAEFGAVTPANPVGWRWRQNQLGKVGQLESELARWKQLQPELAQGFSSQQKAIEALPETAAQRDYASPETPWWHFFKNPVELSAVTLAESAPTIAATVAAAPAGPVAVGAVAGAGSYNAESSGRITAAMSEAGVDLKKPEEVLAWFADRAKSNPAIAKANLAALGPAAFDALSGGLAGKFLGPAMGKGTRQVLTATGKEMGLQMSAGGAGTIAGSVLVDEPIDWKDFVLEVASEFAPFESVSNVRANRKAMNARQSGGSQSVPPPYDLKQGIPEERPVEPATTLALERVNKQIDGNNLRRGRQPSPPLSGPGNPFVGDMPQESPVVSPKLVPAGEPPPGTPAPLETGTTPAATPRPDWQVSVQAPQGEVPGFVQIVIPGAAENTKSPTVESLRAAGVDVPDFSKLPQGRYTYEQAVKMTGNQTETKPAAPTATPVETGVKVEMKAGKWDGNDVGEQPVTALRLTDGTILIDPSARIHAQAFVNLGVDPTTVQDGGFVRGTEYKTSGADTARIVRQANAKKSLEEKNAGKNNIEAPVSPAPEVVPPGVQDNAAKASGALQQPAPARPAEAVGKPAATPTPPQAEVSAAKKPKNTSLRRSKVGEKAQEQKPAVTATDQEWVVRYQMKDGNFGEWRGPAVDEAEARSNANGKVISAKVRKFAAADRPAYGTKISPEQLDAIGEKTRLRRENLAKKKASRPPTATEIMREQANEFDRLLLEYGHQMGWISDAQFEALNAGGTFQKGEGQGGDGSAGKRARDSAWAVVKKQTMAELGGKFEESEQRHRAVLLPKLKERIEQWKNRSESDLTGVSKRDIKNSLADWDAETGQADQPIKPDLKLAPPESREEFDARIAREQAAAAKAKADSDAKWAEDKKKRDMLDKAAKPIGGDLGIQTGLFEEAPKDQGDIFATKSAEEILREKANEPKPNVVVTDERAEILRKRLRDKLGGKNVSMGVDPTIFSDAVQLGAYYIEKGFHRFEAWSEKMLADFGESIRAHLKSIYETARITIESPVGETMLGKPPGLQEGLRPPGERIVTARAEFTKQADESVIPEKLARHLDPHQRQGAAHALTSLERGGGFLLADGTGAGKTRQALTVAQYYADKGKRVIIVTKAETIKPDWKKNIFGGSYGFDGKQMGVPIKLARDGMVNPGEIGITTYENLNGVERHADRNTVLIFDESHALKNDSIRAKLGMRAIDKSDKVMFMSATPADKPEHIYYLAKVGIMEGKTVQQQLRDLGMTLVEMEKMVKENGKFVKRKITFWAEDQRVSDQERHRRFSSLFDRMTSNGAMVKREISMDGVHVQVLKLALPPEAHQTMEDILRFFDVTSVDELQGLKKAQVLGHQRRQQEPYKIASTVMLAQRELAAGRQVVIFVSRVNASEVGKWVKMGNMFGGEQERVREVLMRSEGTAKSMREAFEDVGVHDIAEIHGNADQASLDAMADFQSGKKRVVIATIESGGTGINLDDTIGNRPRSMIVVTAPFDAVGNVQAAGRIWRLKTLSKSSLYYLFGDTDVDAWNADIIGSKMATLGAVVEGQVRRLDISDADFVGTDDYHAKVKSQPEAESPAAATAVPILDWKPFKTKAGKDKFVAPATKEFWDWWQANGQKANTEGLSVSKWQDKWNVWTDKIPTARDSIPDSSFQEKANQLADKLDALKSGIDGGKGGKLNLFGAIPAVWDAAVSLAQKIIRTGGTVADAVAKAIEYIKANHSGAFDEAGARRAIEQKVAEPLGEDLKANKEYQDRAAYYDEVSIIRASDDHPAATDEGVLTKRANVYDTVLSRPGLNVATTAASVDNARAAFKEVGLDVVQGGDGLFRLADTTVSQEVAGHRLAARLEQEITEASASGREGMIANLLLSVNSHMVEDSNKAFSQPLRDRLGALAQGEASRRGSALGSLSMFGRILSNVAQNAGYHLRRIYSQNYGGDVVGPVMEKLVGAFREFFNDHQIAAALDPLNLHETALRFIHLNEKDAGSRVYRAVQGRLKPEKAKTDAQKEAKAREDEAIEAVIRHAESLGVKEPKPLPNQKLTPDQRLAKITTPKNQERIQQAIEQAVKDAEFAAGWRAEKNAAAGNEDLLAHIAEQEAAGEEPSAEMIEKGFQLKEFQHWKPIRDNMLGYSPTTIKLVQDVIKGRVRGTKFNEPADLPPDTRIDLAKLAKSPVEEQQRVFEAQAKAVRDLMKDATPDTVQRVSRLFREPFLEQLQNRQQEIRDRIFTEKSAGITKQSALDALREKVNAGLLDDPRLKDPATLAIAAEKAVIQNLLPNATELVKRILDSPRYKLDEIKTDIAAGLVKQLGLTSEQARTLSETIYKALEKPLEAAKLKALEKVQGELSPAEKKIFFKDHKMQFRDLTGAKVKGRTLWAMLEHGARSGLFDANGVLETMAQAQGWKMPTEAQKAEMKAMAEKEIALRTPSQRQIDDQMGDVEKATKVAEAATKGQREQLIKIIQANWSRWANPIDVMAWFGDNLLIKQNNARAINELAAANLLATFQFVGHQFVDVGTSMALSTSNRALVHAIERFQNGTAPVEAVTAVFNEMLTSRIQAMKATLRQAEQTLTGNTRKNITERLKNNIGVFDRARAKADEMQAAGNEAGAIALRLSTILEAGYRIAATFDTIQGVGMEWQEMRHQLGTALRQAGHDNAYVLRWENKIFGDIKLLWQEGLVEAEASALERGDKISKKMLESNAWEVVKQRTYEAMSQAVKGVDFRAENEQHRLLKAWELPEKGGLGGLVADRVKGFKSGTEKIGLPTFGVFAFGNAMGIATTRMLSFMGGAYAPKAIRDMAFGESPWYQGDRNLQERRIEGAQGLMVIGAITALAMAGQAVINVKYPEDKDEKERFIADGHELNTIEFWDKDHKTFNKFSLTLSPFSMIASPLYMMGGVQQWHLNRDSKQRKLDAEAAKTGAVAEQLPGMQPSDGLSILVQGAYGLLSGGRTAQGAIQSFSNYGEFKLNKVAAGVLRNALPGAPAWQGVARMMGAKMDTRTATVMELLLPTPWSPHQQVNSLGDSVADSSAIQRVLRTMIGFGWGETGAKNEDHAYRQLYLANYSAPAPSADKGYNFNGVIRPMKPAEMEAYSLARGQKFKQELAGMDVNGMETKEAHKVVAQAFRRANDAALESVGVTVNRQPAAPSGGAAITGGGGRVAGEAGAGVSPRGFSIGGVRRTGGASAGVSRASSAPFTVSRSSGGSRLRRSGIRRRTGIRRMAKPKGLRRSARPSIRRRR